MRIFLGVVLAFIFSMPCYADWRDTLRSNFDIVETFDTLQDWTVDGVYGYSTSSSTLPKESNGDSSIFDFFSYWSHTTSSYDWIADHGASNVWQGTGKSLRLT